MIAHINGTVSAIQDGAVIIEIAGLGWSVQVPSVESFQGVKTVTLYTYMHWNTEQGPSLYGFKTETEKKLFILLVGCSGIGPKMALTILGQLSPILFIKAIQENDEKALSAISGIGPKKAEQIVVQLKHKVAKLIDTGIIDETDESLSMQDWKHITQVLQSLNYSKGEIELALQHVRKEQQQGKVHFDLLIRQALSFLAKRA